MKTHSTLVQLCLATLLSSSVAFSGEGWRAKIAEIRARAAAPITSAEDSNELIGDLVTPGPTTPIGQVLILSLKCPIQANGVNEVGCKYHPWQG